MKASRSPLLRYLAAGALVAVAACGPAHAETLANGDEIHYGDTQALGLGIIKPYVVSDKDGHPMEVGVRLTPATMDGLPKEDTTPPWHLMMDFPEQANSTVINHLMINWYSHGRKPPELFGQPQMAFHFYTVPEMDVMSIDPKGSPQRASHLLDAKYTPQDYKPEPGGTPAEKTVPAMGLHWLDTAREFGPGHESFKEVFVNGSWDGKLIFLEPVATAEFLKSHPAVHSPIKQPQAYQKDGYYPTAYNVYYDGATNEYVISLSGMQPHKAS